MVEVIPLEDRVLVRREEHSYQTDSGLYLPEGTEDRSYPEVGVVVSVGKGKVLPNGNREPIDVEVGDRVVFGRYAGTDATLDGYDDYVFLQQFEILAIASKDADVEWSHSL